MQFAQILDGVIVNIIELDDITLLPNFTIGYDSCTQIDGLNPVPTIGWSYNFSNLFTPPTNPAINQQFGNQILLSFNNNNINAGIYAAGQTAAFLSYTSQLYSFLSSGYLNDSIDTFTTMIADTSTDKTNLSPFITNDILYAYLNQIQTFLGITLTVNPGP
jgi:hypothetical protein